MVVVTQKQQGFRDNRSIANGQVEKALEFVIPLFLGFVDFTQKFDGVKLKVVLKVIKGNNKDYKMQQVIKPLNRNNTTQLKTRTGLTNEFTISWIGQGDRQSKSYIFKRNYTPNSQNRSNRFNTYKIRLLYELKDNNFVTLRDND